MTIAEFLKVLGETESNDNPNVHLGDSGRALGRFQIHPDWMDTQEKRFGIRPLLNETWDAFLTRLVAAFFNHYVQTMEAVEVAMYFHLGHHALPTDADWDMGYAQRFQTFAADAAHS